MAGDQTTLFVFRHVKLYRKIIVVDLDAFNFASFNFHILNLNIIVHNINIPEQRANSWKCLSVFWASVIAHHEWWVAVVPDRPQILGDPLEKLKGCDLARGVILVDIDHAQSVAKNIFEPLLYFHRVEQFSDRLVRFLNYFLLFSLGQRYFFVVLMGTIPGFARALDIFLLLFHLLMLISTLQAHLNGFHKESLFF